MNADMQFKKQYLCRYKKALMHERVLKEQLDALYLKYGLPRALSYDGMPKGTTQSDLSDFAAVYFDIIQQLTDAELKALTVRREITRRIEAMNSEVEKTLLYYRYVLCLRFDEIADKLGYSLRHTVRIHGEALRHFEI